MKNSEYLIYIPFELEECAKNNSVIFLLIFQNIFNNL